MTYGRCTAEGAASPANARTATVASVDAIGVRSVQVALDAAGSAAAADKVALLCDTILLAMHDLFMPSAFSPAKLT